MQIMKVCNKCNATYYIDSNDYIELCHECYIQAGKDYKKYKHNFKKSHDKDSEPVCFSEYCNNDFIGA